MFKKIRFFIEFYLQISLALLFHVLIQILITVTNNYFSNTQTISVLMYDIEIVLFSYK